MPVNDELGTRMKEFYEQVPKTRLVRRTPVAIRIDGKAFHTFTRGFGKPFDEVLIRSMQQTMKYLCENIQGCVLGYHQSDEITLILVDYKKLTSSAWFEYEVQKLCSIAASMATMAFNKFFEKEIQDFHYHIKIDPVTEELDTEQAKQFTIYKQALNRGAMFDARCFNIPKEEVTNLIYWRQLDATRNSIQMVGQANFSHKELQNKSCNKIQDMLMTQRGINWNDFPVYQKRGSCCIKSESSTTFAKVEEDGTVTTGSTERPHWIIDNNIPIFKNEDRAYIDKLIFIDDNEPSKPIILD
jgi:tRNA(His) 5'-end guanylyltransferase